MTDNTSSISGDYPGGIPITCILNEGAPTVTSRTYGRDGTYDMGLTWASELKKGDIVAITNDTTNTYAAAGGIPVVETPANGETLVIGYIDEEPTLRKMPANTAAGDSLAKRLAGGYYRYATVVILGGITAVRKATVVCDGTYSVVPGVGTTIAYNITSGSANNELSLYTVENTGVGIVPFHAVPIGDAGDTYSCLVGITGMLIAVTGA